MYAQQVTYRSAEENLVMSDDSALRLRAEDTHESPKSAFGNPNDAARRLRLLVDAAAVRFEAHGFHGTSLQQIADDVGITKAALYHYVNSKEHLLFMIHDAFVTAMIESAEEFIASGASPSSQLSFFIADIFDTVTNYRPYVKAFFRDYGVLKGELQTKLRDKRDYYERLVENAIAAGIEDGSFTSDIEPRHAALFLFGACNWSFHWIKPNEPARAKELAQQWENMFLRGLISKD